MAYTEQVWADGDPTKPVSAARLQHIEDGLAAVANGGSITYLPASNGSDDTATIQAVLDAMPASGGTVAGKLGESYKISAALKVYSGQTLMMAGCTVTLTAGSNTNMLHNKAWVTGSGRDTNIRVIGGTWVYGNNAGAGQQSMALLLQRVDGVGISDLKVTSTNGKYAVALYACTQFEAARLTFSVNSDGVHVSGASSQGSIHDIYGTCGDDAAALTPVDYAAYKNGDIGDITDVDIYNIFTTQTGGSGAKAIGGTDTGGTGLHYACRRINIRNVTSNASASPAVFLGGDSADTNTTGGSLFNITVSHVRNTGGQLGVFISKLGAGGTLDNLTLDHIECSESASSSNAIQFDATGSALACKNVTVRDCVFTSVAGLQPVFIGGGSTIEHLVFDSCTFNQPAATYGVYLNGAVTVNRMKFDNCRLNVQTASAGLVIATSGATVNDLWIKNLSADQCSWIIGDWASGVTTNLYLSNIKAGTVSGLIFNRSGSTINLISASGLTGAHCRHLGSTGTVTGQIVSQGTGAPTFAGQVGDLYDRQDGGAGTYRYRCTTAGDDGASVWTGIL